jgi:HSP20 family protein
MIVVRTRQPRSQSQRRSDLDDVYRALMTGGGAATGRAGRAWRPPIDVYETEDAVEVMAEIAGLDRDAIELVIDGDTLSLRGHRGDPTVCDHRSFHEACIHYGDFAADVFIPIHVDAERAEAIYENGFLRISLPRARGRTIIPTRASSEQEHTTQAEDQDRRTA